MDKPTDGQNDICNHRGSYQNFSKISKDSEEF